MKQLHTIQLSILNNLLFVESARYTDIKPNKEIENNQFDFHLKQLIDAGYAQKVDSKYALTTLGKEYANRIDTEDVKIITQAKIGVFVCGVREDSGNKEFLLITRKKQPFFGCQGFMSGKVPYGEQVIETAKRELLEEANLTGEPKIVSIRHYRVYDKNTKNLVEDKFIYYCRVDNPQGDLKPNAESDFTWVAENELQSFVTSPVESYSAFKSELDEIALFDGNVKFQEIDYETVKF
jgi:ADP-ribose pyrophosphatase YjhB (NUDIX family)